MPSTHHVLYNIHVKVGGLEELPEQQACFSAGGSNHCLTELLLSDLCGHIAPHEHAAVYAHIPAHNVRVCVCHEHAAVYAHIPAHNERVCAMSTLQSMPTFLHIMYVRVTSVYTACVLLLFFSFPLSTLQSMPTFLHIMYVCVTSVYTACVLLLFFSFSLGTSKKATNTV